MKKLSHLTTRQLAAIVGEALERRGFTAVLTGGACVMVYAEGKYVSRDLDFVIAPPASMQEVEAALAELGFRASGRVYVNPNVDVAIDVGNRWPLSVGGEILEPPAPRRVAGHRLRMLSPTDCVKDRLAAFYYWTDRQALEQAVLVALAQSVDVREVGRWSRAEGEAGKFVEFQRELSRRRRAAAARIRHRAGARRTKPGAKPASRGVTRLPL